jgi:hypothetical protein
MVARGITEEDVELAKRRPVGPPDAGSSMGSVVVEGVATGGRRLKIVLSTTDSDLVISTYWVF